MRDVIDTDGVSVNESAHGPHPTEVDSSRARSVDIPAGEAPAYTIAGALAYVRDPRNAATLEAIGAELKSAPVRIMHNVGETVGSVGRVMVDMATDDTTRDSLFDSFLRSITGIED